MCAFSLAASEIFSLFLMFSSLIIVPFGFLSASYAWFLVSFLNLWFYILSNLINCEIFLPRFPLPALCWGPTSTSGHHTPHDSLVLPFGICQSVSVHTVALATHKMFIFPCVMPHLPLVSHFRHYSFICRSFMWISVSSMFPLKTFNLSSRSLPYKFHCISSSVPVDWFFSSWEIFSCFFTYLVIWTQTLWILGCWVKGVTLFL